MAMFSDAVINFFFNSKQALRTIDDFKKNVSNSFKSMSNNIMSGVGGLAATYFGAKALKGVYDDTMKIIDVSDKWNRPVEAVSKFANVMAMFGGSTDEALGNIETLENAIMELRTTGGGALKSVANQIGLNLYKSDGSIYSSIELIDQLRNKLSGLNTAGRNKVLSELGMDSPATIRMLSASQEEYSKLKAEASKFGVINSDNAKQMIAVQQSIAQLKQSFKSLAGELLTTFKPVIDWIVSGMQWFVGLNSNIKKVIIGIGIGLPILMKIGGVLKTFIKPFMTIIKLTKAFVGLLKGMALAANMNPIMLAITLIAGAAYLLINNWEKVKKFFSGLWDGIIKGVEWAKNKLSSGWNWLKDAFSGIGDCIIDGFKNGIDYLKDAWQWILDKVESVKKFGQDAIDLVTNNKITRFFGLAPEKSTPEIQNPEVYRAGAVSNNSSITNNSKTNTVNIQNLNVQSNDAKEFSQQVNNLANQSASGLMY